MQVPTVLFSTPAERRVGNPYISLLEDAIGEEGWRVRRFSPWVALFGKYQVLHVHWPEGFIMGRSRVVSWLKSLFLALLLLRLAVVNTVVVRTVHNAKPHDTEYRPIQKALANGLDRRTDVWIHLSEHSMEEMGHDRAVLIPHGSYVDWYPPLPGRNGEAPSCLDLLYFGQVRPYKGVEQLIAAVAQTSGVLRTLIAGNPSTASYGAQVDQLAKGVEGVETRLEFIPDNELWEILASCSLVVLPFRDIWNSGSLLLALSAGRPVLISDSRLAREFEKEFGFEWIHRFSGDLNGEALVDGLRWACDTADSRAERPSFDKRAWPEIGRAHVRVYNGDEYAERYSCDR